MGKRPFGAELRINGDDEEKSAKRPPIYDPFSPLLVQLFWASSSFELWPPSAIYSLTPLGPGITFRPSRITFMCAYILHKSRDHGS